MNEMEKKFETRIVNAFQFGYKLEKGGAFV